MEPQITDTVLRKLMLAAEMGDLNQLTRPLKDIPLLVNTIDDDGNTIVVKLVLGRHAKVLHDLSQLHLLPVDHENDRHLTPLMLAASLDYGDVVKVLLSLNADVNAKNEKLRTPLSIAAANGSISAVQELVRSSRAVIDKVDEDGLSALMLAANKGHAECCRMLVEDGGASTAITTKFKKTLLTLAKESGDQTTIQFIKDTLSPQPARMPVGKVERVEEAAAAAAQGSRPAAVDVKLERECHDGMARNKCKSRHPSQARGHVKTAGEPKQKSNVTGAAVPPESGVRTCKYGVSCVHLRAGTCTYFHPPPPFEAATSTTLNSFPVVLPTNRVPSPAKVKGKGPARSAMRQPAATITSTTPTKVRPPLLTGSTVDMSTDPHPPTEFTHDEWCDLRNTLFDISRNPGAGELVQAPLGQIAKAMNLSQEYYGESMTLIALLCCRVMCEAAVEFHLGPAFPQETLHSRIDKIPNCTSEFTQLLNDMRKNGNKATHIATARLNPEQKPVMVGQAFKCAREILRQFRARLPTPLRQDNVDWTTWSLDDVCEWLKNTVDIPQSSVDIMRTNDYDGRALMCMQDDELLHIQMPMGHVGRIRVALKQLKE